MSSSNPTQTKPTAQLGVTVLVKPHLLHSCLLCDSTAFGSIAAWAQQSVQALFQNWDGYSALFVIAWFLSLVFTGDSMCHRKTLAPENLIITGSRVEQGGCSVCRKVVHSQWQETPKGFKLKAKLKWRVGDVKLTLAVLNPRTECVCLRNWPWQEMYYPYIPLFSKTSESIPLGTLEQATFCNCFASTIYFGWV